MKLRRQGADPTQPEGLSVSIKVQQASFSRNVIPSTESGSEASVYHPTEAGMNANPAVVALTGMLLAFGFYAIVLTVSWAPMQRYFLGHPVAVAATVLFWFAVAVLISKWFGIVSQSNRLEAIRDEDLMPPTAQDSPAGRWLEENDARHVAKGWLAEITRLPSSTRDSHLVRRLGELLTRQSQRGNTKHLADDLRELSARDADAAHDSLGLVRIIIWAIPMLGFLGTVIGITQTLGGLDFSNGTAAVQNLKSGLYVAFDTTALGLVLSVVAIFLQFPIERNEQRLLAAIDARVGHLVSACLPSDEASDNQTALIADLCRGVQAAVAESLDNQAKLWRETIDAAQNQWNSVQQRNNNTIAEAFETTLVPALLDHAKCVVESSRIAGETMEQQCRQWSETVDQARRLAQTSSESASREVIDGLQSVLKPALVDHAASLDESAQIAADRLERQCHQWQESICYHSDTLSTQQLALVKQYEALTEAYSHSESIAALQQSLDANLRRLSETNATVVQSVSAAGGNGMADAMRVLARAVDVLSQRMSDSPGAGPAVSSRRAA